MYAIGPSSKDSVIELRDIPQSSVGAPSPAVIADEHYLAVIFCLETPEIWQVQGAQTDNYEELVAVVTFERAIACYHGAPNDEALSGHPLYRRGLRPYGAFEVVDSTWVSDLINMNRVHPAHHDKRYAGFRHFVLTFHDSIFECIAKSYTVATGKGSIRAAAQRIVQEMKWQLG